MPTKFITKEMFAKTKVLDEEKMTLDHCISDDAEDRVGDDIDQKGWITDSYLQNPVVLDCHNYDRPPIGKCLKLYRRGNQTRAITQFAPTDEGKKYFQLYKSGFMNAFSVGFIPKEFEPNKYGGYHMKKQELLEYSVVTVPCNPRAIKSYFDEIGKGVLPYHPNAKSDENDSWDASKEESTADIKDLKMMCAWFNSDEQNNKGSYKLPHHKNDSEYHVVWNGVKAAMGALLGAQGGVDMPDSDKQGVYNHLVKHYQQFGKKPPEFHKSFKEENKMKTKEIEELINKSVKDALDPVNEAHKKELEKKDTEISDLKKQLDDIKVKSGAKLSKASVDTLRGISKGLRGHADTLEKFIGDDTGNDDNTIVTDGEKDYTDEEIQKMVADKVQKQIDDALKLKDENNKTE